MTPTARTLQYLRKQGYHAFVVERWNAYAKIRQDVGGFMDVLAWIPDVRMALAVQATSTPNVAARVTKCCALDAARDWVLAGNRLVVFGWAKQGPRGKVKHWTLTQRHLVWSDHAQALVAQETRDP